MRLNSILTSRLTSNATVLSTLLLTAACVTNEPKPAPEPQPSDEALAQAKALGDQQSAKIRGLEGRNAEIQLQLLERDAQVTELQDKLNEAIQEVVRTKAKLHTVESKAEAASTMAEAEIALKQVKSATEEADPAPELTQAEQLLTMSAAEFEDENYGGSLYLATQAKGLVRVTKTRLRETGELSRPDEARFSVPLPMQTTKKSNVRKGPGTGFGVAFTLGSRTAVTGLAYKSQWVRIEAEDGRTGWIYHSLVTSRQK